MTSCTEWPWSEVSCVLMWKLVPQGIVITRKDLASLPQESVLLEDREESRIRFSWVSIQEAQKLAKPLADKGQKAGVSTLEGRWQKLGAVLLWKLARDGVVLTQMDRDHIPPDKLLYTQGFKDDVSMRLMPIAEARALAKRERDNEGRIILEGASPPARS